MKSIYTIIITLCFFSFSGYAQIECSKYYPMEEGTSFQITNYSKKGKVSGILDYSITDNRVEDEK